MCGTCLHPDSNQVTEKNKIGNYWGNLNMDWYYMITRMLLIILLVVIMVLGLYKKMSIF